MKILICDSWELDYVGWPCMMWMQNGPFCFFVSFILFSCFYRVTTSASFVFHTSHFAFGHVPQEPYIHWYVIFSFFFWNYFCYCFSVWGCTGKCSLMPWFQLKSLSFPPSPSWVSFLMSLFLFHLPFYILEFFSPSPLLTSPPRFHHGCFCPTFSWLHSLSLAHSSNCILSACCMMSHLRRQYQYSS